jgi:hypothetical protein
MSDRPCRTAVNSLVLVTEHASVNLIGRLVRVFTAAAPVHRYIEANRLEFLPKALFELSAFVHGLGHLRKVRFGFVPGHTCQSIHCCGALLSQRLEGGAGALSNDPEYDSDTDSDAERDVSTTDGHVGLGT